MANKIPLKAIYSGSNTSALSELQSGDTIAVSYIDGLQAGLDAKLPLAGGTMTGALSLGAGIDVTGTTQTDSLTVQGAITEQETTKTASFTPNLATDGTIFDVSGTITVTMPAATAGKSFTIIDSGSGTLSWSGTIKWPSATVPAPSGSTIYSFVSNGTNWYGMMAGTGFA